LREGEGKGKIVHLEKFLTIGPGSASGHWGVTPKAQSLEETLWTPSYQLAEGD